MDDIRDVKVAFMVTLLQSVDSILWKIACNSVMNFVAWEQIISSETLVTSVTRLTHHTIGSIHSIFTFKKILTSKIRIRLCSERKDQEFYWTLDFFPNSNFLEQPPSWLDMTLIGKADYQVFSLIDPQHFVRQQQYKYESYKFSTSSIQRKRVTTKSWIWFMFDSSITPSQQYGTIKLLLLA